MKERNTKQKEAILNFILSTTSHPTIQDIYQNVKKENPTIGQATIYRNIARLVEVGAIKKITTKDGEDHYDGNIMEHIHFHCTSCNELIDIMNSNFKEEVLNLENANHIKISNYELLLRGMCHECIKNEKRKKEN